MWRCIRKIKNVAEFPMKLGRDSGDLVSKTQIERDLRAPVPVVLHVCAKYSLAQVTGRQCVRKGRSKFGRLIRKKVCQRTEIKNSYRINIRNHIKLHPLDAYAEFKRMRAATEKHIIIILERIPSIEHCRGGAETATEGSDPPHVDLCRVPSRNRA